MFSTKTNLLLVLISLLILSCKTQPTDIVYFENTKNLEKKSFKKPFDPVYKTGDIISIFVSATDMVTARPFNLDQGTTVDYSNETENSNSANSIAPTYQIDDNGNIEFPVLGELKVGGLTNIQVKKLIKEQLKTYINDPVVNVKLTNFKITVLGEVNRPGSYTFSNNKVTIIDVLGLSGDLTIKGKRKNITVIRENDTIKTFHKIDLTSKNVFDSPAYYLNQNDIVYVEPNESKIKESVKRNNTVGIVLGAISTIMTIALSVVTLTR